MLHRDLPEYPAARGERRGLDEAWLELLHRDGISRFLKVVPTPPHELGRSLEEFNRGQYWRCHESLEGIWLPEKYPLRLFYHGLIKAAVGLLHLERRNRHGALVKLSDAEYTLAPFLPHFMLVNTEKLWLDIKDRLAYVQDAEQVDWEAVENLPAVQIAPVHGPHQPSGR